MDIIGKIGSKVSILWEWFKVRADSGQAQFWLFIAGFIDSFIFFFPPEVLYAGMVTAKREHVLRYTAIALLSTFLGALIAYSIGLFFFDTLGVSIIQFMNAEFIIAEIETQFLNNAFLIIFLAMWTPVPSVPVVISAGFFGVPLLAFAPGVILGRAVRFVAIGILAYYFGDEALRFFARYARYATVGIFILTALYFAITFFGVF